MDEVSKHIEIQKEDYLLKVINGKLSKKYLMAIIITIPFIVFGIWGLAVTLSKGLSPWGINNHVSWGISISNFIFWIGIAHSGTFISAILFLLNQKWRNEFNRISELMTIISIIIAASFPLIHTGRPWFASYWLFPYINNMSLLPNFNSPLTWDIIAILTYFIISVLFFYMGLFPDLSLLKSNINNRRLNNFFNMLSGYWIGSKNQWSYYWTLYLILAGIATPLVISVHSVVSYDFAVTFIKSWHSAIMPPYFVVGAIFSGLAMVNVIYIIYKYLTNGLDKINKLYLEKLNKVIIFLSLAISFVYLSELLTIAVENSWKTPIFSMFRGGELIIIMLISNCIIPLLFLFKRVRINHIYSFLISLAILLGMWLERYIIVINGQNLSTLIVNNSDYSPTLVDCSLLFGSFGLFILIILIIGKFIPLFTLFERSRK